MYGVARLGSARDGGATRVAFGVLTALIAIVALRVGVVPLVRAFAAAGAWLQLASLAMVAALGFVVARVERAGARAAGAAIVVVFLQLTSAVNVGDLALALAMTFFADALAVEGSARRRLLAVVAGWLVVAALALRASFAAREAALPAVATQQQWMQVVLLMASLALVAVPPLLTRAGATLSPRLERLVVATRSLGLAAWLVAYVYLVAHFAWPQSVPLAAAYDAHLFVPLVAVLAVLVPCLASLLTALGRRAVARDPLGLVGVPAVLAFTALLVWSSSAVLR